MAMIDISNILNGFTTPVNPRINLPGQPRESLEPETASADTTDFSATSISSSRRMTLTIAERNLQAGVNLINSAEDVLELVTTDLNSISEKAQTAADDSTTDSKRAVLQTEIDALIERIEYNIGNASFNGVSLFTGDTVTVPIDENPYTDINVEFPVVSEESLELTYSDFTSQSAAETGLLDVYRAAGKLADISANLSRDKGLMQTSLDELTKIRSLDTDSDLYELNTESVVELTGGITPYTPAEANALLATQTNKLESGIVTELLS